ncbi:MAG TPA: hypothetical protein VL371_08125 [Gemmataceae bacterium]|nr:hypothetical protein [Gemmataceae bacterium]
MEHGLILLIEAILAIDRHLQKPLRHVIPDLPRLRLEPAVYLASEEVIVGPRRPYAVATVLGLVLAITVLVGFVLSALDNPRNGPGAGDAVVAGVAVLVTFAATVTLLLHWLRGGSAVLRREGVALIHRGRTVFCPWSLFQTLGAPYQPDHKRVILPVNMASPVGLSDGDEAVVARPVDEIKSRQFQGSSEGQVALTDLYEVKLPELGELFLHLGRQLGTGPSLRRDDADDFVAGSLAPLATTADQDWVRVRLTRLPFPPVCTGCGVYTRDSYSHPLAAHGVAIDVPVCQACQEARAHRRRRAFWFGVGVGALPSLVWVMATAPFLRGMDVCLGLGVLLPIGLVIGTVVALVIRERAEPVRFKDYSASAGTVAMWLRPSAGRKAFRAALGLAESAAPAAAE